jgi:plastocyanin
MNLSVSYKTSFSLFFPKLLLIAVSFLLPLGAVAATHEVQVLDPRSFSPSSLTIEVGDTVRWINASGGASHNVKADDLSFSSETSPGFTFERTFNSVAEILYHCSVHSTSAASGGTAMNGQISVIEATISTDVSVESVNAIDGAYEAGEDFRVEATLTNTGGDESGMFKVNFYASTDGNVTSSDTLLGTKDINNIAAGASMNINESVDLPDSLIAGDYFVGAIIDLNDNDSSNNSNVDETPIYVFTEFVMNAGLNDAWFDSSTNGQGFFITIFPDLGFVSLAWFTYDTEQPPPEATANLGDPGHRWLTAGGFYTGNEVVMDIDFTSGGIFDTPTDVEHTDPAGSDGTLTLTFDNCGMGRVEYDITSIDAQGTVPIKRVADDNVVVCNALLKDFQMNQ